MEITLSELLDSREVRAEKQKDMILRYGAPIISFTMNVPGPEKTSPIIERAFTLGKTEIEAAIGDFSVNDGYIDFNKCGPTLIYSVNADAKELKRRLTKIEDSHRLGRLFDMDVLDTDGKKLDRETERGCIICGKIGRGCSAGRLHPISVLTERVASILNCYFKEADAEKIAGLIKESLIDEVKTAPKPGLVDPITSGSHSDMNEESFIRSANALEEYFKKCAILGYESKKTSHGWLFNELRLLGKKAEGIMLESTGGVNTHKGAIFSFGILSGAAGRLLTPSGHLPSIEKILLEAAQIAKSAIESDLAAADGKTAGERAYLELGKLGIRGEAASGFSSVKKISLPIFREYIKSHKSKKDAGALTLLHLIANVYDTSLYKRGGNDGVLYAQEAARELLSGREPTVEEILALDRNFTERNLSPGGCADLLAITYFLFELEKANLTSPRD